MNDGWMDGWVEDKWTDGWMDGLWTDGWMNDGWIGGWWMNDEEPDGSADRQTDRRACRLVSSSSFSVADTLDFKWEVFALLLHLIEESLMDSQRNAVLLKTPLLILNPMFVLSSRLPW